mgnify:CR=1 FL=1
MTPADIHGPARGSAHPVTRYRQDATRTRGTLNNCGTGKTPWGTYVSGEENWFGYFHRDAKDDDRRGKKDPSVLALERYGRKAGAASRHDYNWYNGGMAGAPTDYNGHGTHTMGTIIGDDGGENQIGVAPGAQWIACPGVGSPYVGPFECFEFFLAPTRLDGTEPRPDLAPHVISNSWSGAGTNYQAAIQVVYAAGIFFSKSAGNTGPGCSTVTNPGQWPEVTAVANFMQGDAIASSSSRGPVTIGYDQYVKPDLAAPGTSIRSSIPGSIYGTMSGTSMACPHVTGAVALLINANPELAGKIDVEMDDSGSIAFVAKQFNKSRKAIRAYLRFNRDIEKVGPVRLKSCRD